MKVALVILHADASRGGAERYTLDLAEALVARGHDVSILASSFQEAPTAGKRVLISSTGWTRTGRYNSFNRNVSRATISDPSFDVIHAMLPVLGCNIYHPHAGIASNVISSGHCNKSGAIRRAIAWVGNRTNVRRLRFAAVEREILTYRGAGGPPLVLCLSNLIRDVIRQEYPQFPAERLVPLFNGVDLARFDPMLNPSMRGEIRKRYGIPDDAIMGLMLAQDFERKGLQQSIEATALVKDPRLYLLVGGKPDPSKYKKLAASRGVADRVIFAGAVTNPVDFYQAADFFVLPTRFDPCSLVVLEALGMALPVISTIKNGACEVMQDGVHGRVLIDPLNVKALADAMSELLDPDTRLAMTKACERLRLTLSQALHVQKLEEYYLIGT